MYNQVRGMNRGWSKSKSIKLNVNRARGSKLTIPYLGELGVYSLSKSDASMSFPQSPVAQGRVTKLAADFEDSWHWILLPMP